MNAHEYIGKFARSIESNWLGKVVSTTIHNGETMLKMVGVNWLCHAVVGGDINEHLDTDDIQWFTPEDVVIVEIE